MQISATMHSSTLSTALMSIEPVSTGFVVVEPVVTSVWASAIPAKSSTPKLPHTEQWNIPPRLMPLFLIYSTTKDLGKLRARRQTKSANVSDDACRIAQACRPVYYGAG